MLAEPGPDVLLPALVVPSEHRHELFPDRRELLAGCHAVGGCLERADLQLTAETRHPDHEELVEVATEDRQELDALEQRMPLVERLFQDATVEREPGELPVDVVALVVEVGHRRCGGTIFECSQDYLT